MEREQSEPEDGQQRAGQTGGGGELLMVKADSDSIGSAQRHHPQRDALRICQGRQLAQMLLWTKRQACCVRTRGREEEEEEVT
eukprot:268695-Hanusia_phi.AAC.1